MTRVSYEVKVGNNIVKCDTLANAEIVASKRYGSQITVCYTPVKAELTPVSAKRQVMLDTFRYASAKFKDKVAI